MLRYSLRQLEYFIAVSDTGSFAAAAQLLHVSQPSISTAMKKLEQQLGVQLLVRHHAQGATPTAAGRRLLVEARNLVSHAGEIARQADSGGAELTGDLAVGSFITLAPAHLPGLITGFTARHPRVSLSVREATQDNLVEGLRQGRIEVGLVYSVNLPDDLAVTPLAAFPPYVLLPAGHPLARRGRIDLAQLAGEPMVLLDVAPSRAYFLGILQSAGVEPDIAFSSPSLELVRGMVGRGLGFSLLVTRPAGDLTYEGVPVAVRPIAQHAEPGRIALARLAALRPTRLMLAFEAFCVEHFSHHQSANPPA